MFPSSSDGFDDCPRGKVPRVAGRDAIGAPAHPRSDAICACASASRVPDLVSRGNAGIRHAAQPLAPAPADQPLELSLRGACALAVAIANQDAVEAAANALPPSVRGRCTSADGRADAAFVKLYELLRETRPEI